MRSFKKSASITVGDRALADLQVRAATERGRAVAAETRDWLLVKAVMQPGERARARVAVRFPNESNAAGFAFVTDQRIMFEFHERVMAVNLAYVVFVGRPSGPSLGDFVVEAQAPTAQAGRFSTTMRVRNRSDFHGFFPTLLDAVRATGAQPEVDADWGGTDRPTTAAEPSESEEALPAEVVDRALARFLEDGEGIVVAAEMEHDVGGGPVTLILTQQRLVVVDGHVMWATPLGRTRPVAGPHTHLRLLAEEVSDSLVLSGGMPSVEPGPRRLSLHSPADPRACERLYTHLFVHGGGALDTWPASTDPS